VLNKSPLQLAAVDCEVYVDSVQGADRPAAQLGVVAADCCGLVELQGAAEQQGHSSPPSWGIDGAARAAKCWRARRVLSANRP
jgi:hypothetical protein